MPDHWFKKSKQEKEIAVEVFRAAEGQGVTDLEDFLDLLADGAQVHMKKYGECQPFVLLSTDRGFCVSLNITQFMGCSDKRTFFERGLSNFVGQLLDKLIPLRNEGEQLGNLVYGGFVAEAWSVVVEEGEELPDSPAESPDRQSVVIVTAVDGERHIDKAFDVEDGVLGESDLLDGGGKTESHIIESLQQIINEHKEQE